MVNNNLPSISVSRSLTSGTKIGTITLNGTAYDLYCQTDTNTKNTAGTTNKTKTKLFLAGATSQAADPQTYSNVNVYIGTDNELYSGGKKVAHEEDSLKVEAVYEAYTAQANIERTIDVNNSPFTLQTGVNASRVVAVCSPMVVTASGNPDLVKIYLSSDSSTSFRVISTLSQDVYIRCLYLYK